MWKKIYEKLLKPRSTDENKRRQELVLRTLLIGTIILSVFSLISAGFNAFMQPSHEAASLFTLAGFIFLLISIYFIIIKGYPSLAASVFIFILFAMVTYASARWGVLLPQALLTFSLIIVMAGVLFDAKAAFFVSILTVMTLLIVKHLQEVGLIVINKDWMKQTGDISDVLVFGFTFGVIALVSWLSNREIERSLAQARRSEKALKEERNNLEIKIAERTKELEKAQVEKMLEMHRFAEFGRMGSTLLHDIANPLTAISLTLSQPGNDKGQQRLLNQVRKDIKTMERYIDGARRQLRNQSEVKLFSVNDEIVQVCDLFATKTRAMNLKIEVDVAEKLQLRGDSTHFNHILSNLISNALDAYQDTDAPRKSIKIIAKKKDFKVCIEVKDFGKGISKEDLPHVFEPFYTTKPSERGSLGIGLAIVKDTIEESFGGTISVKSSPGSGTSFIAKIPLS